MNFIYNFVALIFLNMPHPMHTECERSKCRTVRNIVQQDLLPHYKAVGTKIPYKCPFFKDRDKFLGNEEHKEKESASRWTCGYCGKAFIGEIYLDQHFDNRHQDNIFQESDSVCLGDFCEVFRCDILEGIARPSFWDIKLCMEEDMQDLQADCFELMDQCIAESLHWNASKTLKGLLSKSVCSFLTCKRYFEAPEYVKEQEEEPVSMPYIVLTIFLAIFFILYYCVAINYFWFDTFSDLYEDQEDSSRFLVTGAGSLFKDETVELQKRVMSRRRKKSPAQSNVNPEEDVLNVHAGLESSLLSFEDDDS
ncbi:uncharacterized protein LOC128231592 [Mya arenaria]|uniref:uncharacterized protein LOC128231592 n=1 Tax=Mya arenaria TaxID=6604 RepID=UPI0022E47EF7|nr:uncharacterized protein LOC128231592 [Mya arenaria]